MVSIHYHTWLACPCGSNLWLALHPRSSLTSFVGERRVGPPFCLYPQMPRTSDPMRIGLVLFFIHLTSRFSVSSTNLRRKGSSGSIPLLTLLRRSQPVLLLAPYNLLWLRRWMPFRSGYVQATCWRAIIATCGNTGDTSFRSLAFAGFLRGGVCPFYETPLDMAFFSRVSSILNRKHTTRLSPVTMRLCILIACRGCRPRELVTLEYRSSSRTTRWNLAF